ncbi:MAG: hypothetical protein IT436_17300 [Phycisphaerales bacterium]|nr:hypothetical protein [Phycisphaerales bacterium]
MADTNTDKAPATLEEANEAIAKLRKALDAERTDHTATRAKVGLSAADDEAVEKIVAARLAPAKAESDAALSAATTERDKAVAERDAIRAERAAEKVEGAIGAALGASALIKDNAPDATAMMRGLFHLDSAGAVVTKGGDTGEAAGMTPAQFVASRLTALRGHWFPKSVGGGASGGSGRGGPSGDVSVFDPASPRYSITGQALYERRFGMDRARQAARQFGVTLAGEGRR